MNRKVAIVGLGYVGLPVLISFSKNAVVRGYDYNPQRVSELKFFYDKNNEISKYDLDNSNIRLSDSIDELKKCDFYIIAVPTPVDKNKKPDLSPLIGACKNVASILKKGDIVVFESTVYPGATEEICLPLLESESGLLSGKDFKIGYSPERINPGDKEHTFENIIKVVSAQDSTSLKIVSEVYSSVVKAGVFKAATIKTAEAAKIIENTQRDLNIALMNELALIFSKLGINTHDVLEAANTKWNFLNFYPGLVGGHCIGVDPYYLTFKAKEVGYDPEVILSGRNINDNLPFIIAEKIKEKIKNIDMPVITVLGLTFKENCPDTRNSKVLDIINSLRQHKNISLNFVDPVAEDSSQLSDNDITLVGFDEVPLSDILLFAVSHEEFLSIPFERIEEKLNTNGYIFDVKGIFREISKTKPSLNFWAL
jgi:UDP-N-acetyl-D-glucosamine/UDP-N-acetyl-D-galactosamine dehydrogenase